MAQCFCGCGRTIPFYMFGLRTYNTRGKQVAARIAWAREFTETPPADAKTQRWLEEGDEIVDVIARMVHREADPRTVNEGAIREWQAEGRAAEQDPEQEQSRREARFGRAVRTSGRSDEEIAQALAHGNRSPQEVMEAIERGEDDPFGFEDDPSPRRPDS
jgi:hypothetical protein